MKTIQSNVVLISTTHQGANKYKYCQSNLKSTLIACIAPKCMCLDSGRKLEYLERTYTETGCPFIPSFTMYTSTVLLINIAQKNRHPSWTTIQAATKRKVSGLQLGYYHFSLILLSKMRIHKAISVEMAEVSGKQLHLVVGVSFASSDGLYSLLTTQSTGQFACDA